MWSYALSVLIATNIYLIVELDGVRDLAQSILLDLHVPAWRVPFLSRRGDQIKGDFYLPSGVFEVDYHRRTEAQRDDLQRERKSVGDQEKHRPTDYPHSDFRLNGWSNVNIAPRPLVQDHHH